LPPFLPNFLSCSANQKRRRPGSSKSSLIEVLTSASNSFSSLDSTPAPFDFASSRAPWPDGPWSLSRWHGRTRRLCPPVAQEAGYFGGRMAAAGSPRNIGPTCVGSSVTLTSSALMTGRFSIRSGTYQVPAGRMPDGLVQWEVTLPQLLSQQGYATGMWGKWHLGSDDARLPTNRGFDEWFGIPRTYDEAEWPSSNKTNSMWPSVR
jgi:Sulfatase